MRIRTLTPAIVALIVILCAPFSSMLNCGPPSHGGLICYCCAAGENHTMISCSKCKMDTALHNFDSSPEIILESFDHLIFLQISYSKCDTSQPPGTVYIEVPVKPPNSI